MFIKLQLLTSPIGEPYNYVYLPLSANNVVTTWGQNLGYKGSYVNYYIGNTVVLVPTYNDPNDAVAISNLQAIYPNRTVVGIDVRNLYSQGGMIHCVTQQQPVSQNATGFIEKEHDGIELSKNSPNPFSDCTVISFTLKENSSVKLEVFDSQGKKATTIINSKLPAGEHAYTLLANDYENGIYSYTLTIDEIVISCKKMVVVK